MGSAAPQFSSFYQRNPDPIARQVVGDGATDDSPSYDDYVIIRCHLAPFPGLPTTDGTYHFHFIPFIQNDLGELFTIHHLSIVSYGNELEIYPDGLKEVYETGRSLKLTASAIYGQCDHDNISSIYTSLWLALKGLQTRYNDIALLPFMRAD